MLHAVAASAANVPELHCVHGVLASESTSAYPAAQSVQLAEPAAASLPAAQVSQPVFAPLSPSELSAEPKAPAVAVTLPAAQSVHAVDASLSSSTVPATQAVQVVLEDAPPSSCVPSGQASHSEVGSLS